MTRYPCAECKKECLSELLGTYLLVLLGPASIILASALPGLNALGALASIAFAFGGTVTTVILLFGKYSGAHVNPAITLAHSIARIMRQGLFVPYLLFQLVGGLLAGFTLKWVFGSMGSPSSLGSTKLASSISPSAGIVLELIGTFILSMSALVASSRIHNPLKQGLLVGTTLSVLIFFVGPATGAGFNPARSLGPAVASGYFANQYIYWVGPLTGACLAGLIFGIIRRRHARRETLGTVCMC